LKYDISDMLT